jgi:hypothetical protein
MTTTTITGDIYTGIYQKLTRQSSNTGEFNDALQTVTVSFKNINTPADNSGHRNTAD